MTKYAAKTSVSASASRAEIERILERYGADSFGYGMEPGRAAIMFQMSGRRIRFILPFPDEKEFEYSPAGRRRTDEARKKARDQEIRQCWRALALCIKAKLEAVESGIAEFEDEFLANILLADGRTVGQMVRPEIEQIYQTGTMPPMLLVGGPES